MKVTEILINAERHCITLVYEDGTYWNEITTAIKDGETFEDFSYYMEGTGDINIWRNYMTNEIEAFINGYGGYKLTINRNIALPK